MLLSGVLSAGSAPAADAARWIIGHAAVQTDPSAHGQLHVKLSLRNQGRPDRAAVQLYGRWLPATQAPHKVTAQELRAFALLGRYEREVAMKQTAIVTGSLAVLHPPPATHVLELIVVTDRAVTDQRRVATTHATPQVMRRP